MLFHSPQMPANFFAGNLDRDVVIFFIINSNPIKIITCKVQVFGLLAANKSYSLINSVIGGNVYGTKKRRRFPKR